MRLKRQILQFHRMILSSKILLLFSFLFLLLFISANPFLMAESYNYRISQNLNGVCNNKYSVKPKFKWRVQLESNISSAVIADNTNIIVNCSNGTTKCLETETGKLKWNYIYSECEAPATIIDDNIILCSTNSKIISISAITGKENWICIIGGKATGAANHYKTEHTEYILVGSYDNKAYCIDYKTGKTVWEFEAESYINGSICISKNIGAFGSCDGFVYFINIDSGKLLNKFDTGAYIPGWPLISSDTCFAGNYSGDFFAISIDGAKEKWKFNADDQTIMTGPAVDETSVFICDQDGSLYCLDQKDGLRKWVFRQNDKNINPPLISQDSLFCTSEDTWLYILDKNNGEIRWKYLVGEELNQPPYIFGNNLFFNDISGRVYCFTIN